MDACHVADTFTTNFKPSRLAQDVKRWQRRSAQAKAKQSDQRAAAAVWRALSEQVRQRDKGECRICRCQTVRAGHGDPRRYGGAHHIVYVSAGGSDELSNLIWTCGQCHADEHEHRIVIMGTAEQLTIQDWRNF